MATSPATPNVILPPLRPMMRSKVTTALASVGATLGLLAVTLLLGFRLSPTPSTSNLLLVAPGRHTSHTRTNIRSPPYGRLASVARAGVLRHSFPRGLRERTSVLASNTQDPDFALLFDCDGVIVLTEELHRIAYNRAFEKFDCRIDGELVDWTVPHYDVLQNTIGGGKPKMKWHFNKFGWPTTSLGAAPSTEDAQTALVDQLQDAKTEFYKEIVGQVATARPGVLELMDEAIANPRIACGICSAATKEGFVKVVDAVVGRERLNSLDVVMAGDDVTRKKPDPLIYNKAREKIGLPAERCVVIEDSIVGLKAAKGAGMNCIITYTSSTQDQDFKESGADAVLEDLGKVNLDKIFRPMYTESKISSQSLKS
mmetsp:Transcript_15918/g.39246  ORF Transcript_15918/g.39246 Transcript_15918/m.39246 type:complete len:370 (-) Transcript_15918:306-1415(-)